MRIGIDLGGTKIEGIALAETGEELVRQRLPTPQGDYDATLKVVADLIHQIESMAGETGSVGIGTPGALSPATRLLRNSNSVCMNGKAVLEDLQNLLQREIRMANDANCFALSEAIDGSARNYDVVFGVIIGTGTGAGIVVDRRVLVGPNAIAGEWGHNPLPWPQENELPGGVCYCGKRGCIETWLSGPGWVRDYRLVNEISDDAVREARALASMAKAGDKHAVSSLRRYENRLARSLAHVINILDPDAIVLGGGMGNISCLYDNVPKIWGDYVFSDIVNTKLLAPAYGDSSGVRGAAWLWNEA